MECFPTCLHPASFKFLLHLHGEEDRSAADQRRPTSDTILFVKARHGGNDI